LNALLEASHEIKTQFPKFVKGALACAREGELLSDQLALTKTAENARKEAFHSKERCYSDRSMQKNDFRAKEGEEAIKVESSK
jgi:hypothetical protein